MRMGASSDEARSHVGVMAGMSDPKAPHSHPLGIVGITAQIAGVQNDPGTTNRIGPAV